jgi:hypothetical protein
MGNIDDDIKPRASEEKSEYEDNQYLAKIKRVPHISEEEAVYLITRWRELGDEQARKRAMQGSLHLVLPIAKATTKRFRFTGLSTKTGDYQTRVNVFAQFYQDAIGAGSLGLCEAVDYFDPAVTLKFNNYARRCIGRECIRAAKSLLSAIDRPYYSATPADLMLDPTRADPISPEDYCGSRARPTTGSDTQDAPLGSVHARLRPWPEDWETRFKREDDLMGAKIYDLRKAGHTLKETADRLGMSTTTVWRRQQAYLESIYG